ncbi:MAG: hypothetical protein ACXVB9_16470 [Bdellovibrionota bacterium]
MYAYALALALLSPFANADTSNFDIIRSLDGKALNCSSRADVGQLGYGPDNAFVRVDGNALVLGTDISSWLCVENGGNFGFVSFNLGDPVTRPDLDGNPTTVIMKDIKFLMVDRANDVIGSLDGGNANRQGLKYTIPLQRVLGKGDQGRLEKGETVHVTWEFFIQSICSVRTAHGEVPLGLRTGGSFFFNFDLTQDHGNIRVANFLWK